MSPRKRQALLAALILVAVLAVVWDRYPLPTAAVRLQQLPAEGIGCSSRELEVSEIEREAFGAADVVKRIYQTGTQRFVVTVVDGSRNRHAVHDPTYCFRGAGWRIAAREAAPVPGGEAAWLDLTQGNEHQAAAFWFSDGRFRHSSPLRCWMQTTLRRLTLGRSGEEPLLVLVQPLDNPGNAHPPLAEILPLLFTL
ncbi:MAG: exosortase-associated EpsI family protein [Verrucomicrobiales bacterium]|nr:exosortase-associated EpsI family protein [Verrucomicrobiales bacterium]MCP5527576.1 exosortase-associated EpsI family protein [Verrucomicrobiales bacterium]